jgi:hypothetical protein
MIYRASWLRFGSKLETFVLAILWIAIYRIYVVLGLLSTPMESHYTDFMISETRQSLL